MATRMDDISRLIRLLQFSDSSFPIGTFSFSNGLESATEHGVVYDKASLYEYVRTMITQTAHSDAVVAINAFRSHKKGDYDGVLVADEMVMLYKLNEEARTMSARMGRKMAELACRLCGDTMLKRWLEDIDIGVTYGTIAVAQGMVFSACHMTEKSLFTSLLYGNANMILGAALRCMRIAHYDTQQILFSLNDYFGTLYSSIKDNALEDINVFSPEADILASMHEKGTKRLFMN